MRQKLKTQLTDTKDYFEIAFYILTGKFTITNLKPRVLIRKHYKTAFHCQAKTTTEWKKIKSILRNIVWQHD